MRGEGGEGKKRGKESGWSVGVEGQGEGKRKTGLCNTATPPDTPPTVLHVRLAKAYLNLLSGAATERSRVSAVSLERMDSIQGRKKERGKGRRRGGVRRERRRREMGERSEKGARKKREGRGRESEEKGANEGKEEEEKERGDEDEEIPERK